MSGELSAAEKRRLLREKRANRLANGGTRLNKILGTEEVPGTETKSSQLDKASETKSSSTGSQTSVNGLSKRGNRISMLLDNNDDPPTSSLDEFEVSLESDESPLDEFVSNERAEVNIEEVLNKMLKSSAKDGHEHGEGLHSSTPNSFSDKDMASMLSSMGQIPGLGNFPGFDNVSGSLNASNATDISRSKLLQSTYSFFRVLLISFLVLTNLPESFLYVYALYPHKYSLWVQFLYTEVLFGALQLSFNYLKIFPNNTILSFDVSQFGYANSLLNAYTIIRNFYTDFCTLIVALGLGVYLM
ncbi:hypothetical protein CANINC_004044 [Pichia inconspicua]|uniref:Golgi to ER traffic protein 2 n=1 Tax=Pichia inconspicua TaxID=52247 RepID=A0A4T0WX56_9ASCO|nr:hypothetical protein CANINC_004044 [[Candida] inconspicua]